MILWLNIDFSHPFEYLENIDCYTIDCTSDALFIFY